MEFAVEKARYYRGGLANASRESHAAGRRGFRLVRGCSLGIFPAAMEADAPHKPPPPPRHGCARGLLLAAVLFVLACAAGGLWLRSMAGDALAWLRELPALLGREKVHTTFHESITRLISTQGDVLEVAVLETQETVTRYDMRTALNDLIYLGTTVSEIRTPVVYRYHIRLSDPWQLAEEEGRWRVLCPALRPTNPPALRTDGMEKKSEAGWLRFNAAENMAALERELTPTLEKRAANPAHLDKAREAARQSVAGFVRKWMPGLPQGVQIQVRFADEPPDAARSP